MRLFVYCCFIIAMTVLVIFFIRYWNGKAENTLYSNSANSVSVSSVSAQKQADKPIVDVSQPNHLPLNEPRQNDNGQSLDTQMNKLDEKSFCSKEVFEDKSYIVCRANPDHDKIELFLNDADNKPFKRFYRLENALSAQDKTIVFAMNAGMYHSDYSAVGLYIENGKELYPISTKDGPGNFHMKPNGVFYINDGKAGVLDSESFVALGIKPQLATQSGPMLVINNVLHERFIPQSPYLEYRNGVGVTDSGEVIFVISEVKVNFDEMARFFRDQLKTPNALYFDGSISSAYVAELGRKDWWYALGPMIAVIATKDK